MRGFTEFMDGSRNFHSRVHRRFIEGSWRVHRVNERVHGGFTEGSQD